MRNAILATLLTLAACGDHITESPYSDCAYVSKTATVTAANCAYKKERVCIVARAPEFDELVENMSVCDELSETNPIPLDPIPEAPL